MKKTVRFWPARKWRGDTYICNNPSVKIHQTSCNQKTSKILAILRSLYIEQRIVKMAEFPRNGITREILATLRSFYIEYRIVKMAEIPCIGKTSKILATHRSLYRVENNQNG